MARYMRVSYTAVAIYPHASVCVYTKHCFAASASAKDRDMTVVVSNMKIPRTTSQQEPKNVTTNLSYE